MSIVDGGVMFSDKSGFYASASRFMFAYRHHLWYLMNYETISDGIPACHLAKMHQLLSEYISPDHTEADGSTFQLAFKK